MKSTLFFIPLKKDCLKQYEAFAKETVVRATEYEEMLKRYDIACAKVWHQNIHGSDYVLVYHDVGPTFEEEMKRWDTSEHPFDTWFRNNMMAVYDIENAAGMKTPTQLVNFEF